MMEIKVNIPDNKIGSFEIRSFEIKEEDAKMYNLQLAFAGHGYRAVQPGHYKKLIGNGLLWMSNTPAEIRDHWEFFHEAEKRGGDILINGLGLGVVLTKILQFDNVKSITVIEKEENVIKLIAPHFHDKRLTIIHADALEYKPEKNKRFTCVWHDIWPEICSDNSKTMGTLHRKYARRCDWQGSWARYEVKQLQREEYRNRWY